jgi:hypothetical protein
MRRIVYGESCSNLASRRGKGIMVGISNLNRYPSLNGLWFLLDAGKVEREAESVRRQARVGP